MLKKSACKKLVRIDVNLLRVVNGGFGAGQSSDGGAAPPPPPPPAHG